MESKFQIFLARAGYNVRAAEHSFPDAYRQDFADPWEQVNLADDNRYASVLADLQNRLRAFRAKTPALSVRFVDAG